MNNGGNDGRASEQIALGNDGADDEPMADDPDHAFVTAMTEYEQAANLIGLEGEANEDSLENIDEADLLSDQDDCIQTVKDLAGVAP